MALKKRMSPKHITIMRKFLLIICVTISIFSSAQTIPTYKMKIIDSATFLASYSLKYKQDSLSLDDIKTQEMWLFLGNNVSLFVSKNHYLDLKETSKLTTFAQAQEWVNNQRNYVSRSLYHIFKNYPIGKLTFTEATSAGNFKFEESLDLFNWQLSGDTTTIAAYKAQKAICDFGGRSWIAWFSPEIPFNDGPYKFNGLPGLIVKICDSRKHYVFELLSIVEVENNQMIAIEEYPYIETTKQKFFKAQNNAHSNIINRIKESGGSINSQIQAVKKLSVRNNPIELK